MFGISEIAIVLIVIIVVLGFKKLPDLTRSAGKAARILKSESRAMKDDEGTPGQNGGDPRTIKAAPGDVIGSRTEPIADPITEPASERRPSGQQ